MTEAEEPALSERPRSVRGWVRRTLIVAALAVLLWFGWTYLNRGNLLVHSGRLSYIGTQSFMNNRTYDHPWCWLDDHTLLWYTGTLARTATGWEVTDQRAHAVNVRSGQEREVHSLTRYFQPRTDGHGSTTSAGFGSMPPVSPDGRWLLTQRLERLPARYVRTIEAVSVDGSASCVCYRGIAWPWAGATWMPDSRHWVSLAYDSHGAAHADVHSIETRERFRRVDPVPRITPGASLLGCLKDGTLLLGDWRQPLQWNQWPVKEVSRPVATVGLDLSGSTAAPADGEIRPPAAGRIVRNLSLSPNGDRLAWLTFLPAERHGLASRFADWLLRVGDRAYGRVELWVSNVDGGHPRLLGDRTASAADANGSTMLDRCAWSPDGEQIAFSYGHRLWCINAD